MENSEGYVRKICLGGDCGMEMSQHLRGDDGQRLSMLWKQSQLGFMTEENETKKWMPSQHSWASGFNLR